MRSTLESPLAQRAVVAAFLAFALAYFFSALLRAVTATLAPVFSSELGLGAAQLGLLAGAYFLGFAVMQLPLGSALDRWGAKRVILGLMVLAVAGCVAFALARSFHALLASRALIGVGVSACLMAPLTYYRRVFNAAAQLRANSWMLMTGSLGMVASTLPVQWLLPTTGWRGLFWLLAGALLLAMAVMAWLVRAEPTRGAAVAAVPSDAEPKGVPGYRQIMQSAVFLRLAPLGFFLYGGLVAVQSLWAGPWLTRVCGWSAAEAAAGLLAINLCMLVAFGAWGVAMPRLARRGLHALTLMRWGVPLALVLLMLIVALGTAASAWAWALWCVATSVVALSQPAVAQAFDSRAAGRALSAFNLVIFLGVFAVQWGIGVGVDAAVAAGWPVPDAFRLAFAVFGALCVAAYGVFLPLRHADNGL